MPELPTFRCAEIICGGPGDDTPVAGAGFAELHGGAGFDTFKTEDSGAFDLRKCG